MDRATEIGTLDDYLRRICDAVQLSRTQFETATRRYERVGRHLTEADCALERLRPLVRPQGSMLQGTTIRPTRKGGDVVPYDLDCLCICDFDPQERTSQSLYGSVRSRLVNSPDFEERIRKAETVCPASGKCIRLSYVDDDFYLDVVPACTDPSDRLGIRVLIANPSKWSTHRAPIETWRRTDPLRFAQWLDAQSEIGERYAIRAIRENVKPVPPQEDANDKAPLRLVIQLLKHRRDLAYLGEDVRPTSVMLSALAGRAYLGQASVASGLRGVLDDVDRQLKASSGGRIVVNNPADEIAPHDGGVEDLAAPLDERAWKTFNDMISDMKRMLDDAHAARGAHRLYPILSASFGDRTTKAAFNAVDDSVARANRAGLLGAAVGSSGIRVLDSPRARDGIQPVPSSSHHRMD